MNENQILRNKIILMPVPLGDGSFTQFNSTYLVDILLHTKKWVVENVRTARRFLTSVGLGIVIDDLVFFELNRDASTHNLHLFLQSHIKSGNICVCSEAGLPGMADPGAAVVTWAHENKYIVEPLVGPGSIVLALMASGLNGQQFTFHGYAPIKEPELKQFLGDAGKTIQRNGYTQIFIEAPYRSDRFFQVLIGAMADETRICVAYNIHGSGQWILTKTAREWKREIPLLGKNPCVFLAGIAGKGLDR